MEDKKDKNVKKRVFFLVAAAILLVVNLIFYSLGWFTNTKSNQANGVKMQSDGLPYEIRTKGIIVDYNGLPGDLTNYKDAVSSIFRKLTESYDTEIATSTQTYETSSDKTSIQWLMNDFFDDDSVATGKRFRPGTSGKLTFQVVTTDPKKLNINCDMRLIAFDSNYDEISSTSDVIDQREAFPYLKGHILLFENYENGYYSGMIPFKSGTNDTTGNTGFTFSVDTSDTSGNTEVTTEVVGTGEDQRTIYLQEKTIYWVWPNTLGQLLFESRSPNKGTDPVLFADDLPAQESDPTEISDRKKVYNAIKNDVSAKKKVYFKDLETTTTGFDELITGLQSAKIEDNSDYWVLNKAYNNADQAIGTNIRYLVFQMDTY